MIYQSTCYIQAPDRKIFGFLSNDGDIFFCLTSKLRYQSYYYTTTHDLQKLDVGGYQKTRIVDKKTGHIDFVLFPF